MGELARLLSLQVSINMELMRDSMSCSILIFALDHFMGQIASARDRRNSVSHFVLNSSLDIEAISVPQVKEAMIKILSGLTLVAKQQEQVNNAPLVAEEERLAGKVVQVLNFFVENKALISIYDFIKSPALMQLFINKHPTAQTVVSKLLTLLCKQFVREKHSDAFAHQVLKLLVTREEGAAHQLYLNQPELIRLIWGRNAPLWQMLRFPIDRQLPQVLLFFHHLGMNFRLADPDGRTMLWHLVYQAFNPKNYNKIPLIRACSMLIETLVKDLEVSTQIIDNEGLSIKNMLENPSIDPKTDKYTKANIEEIHKKIINVVTGF